MEYYLTHGYADEQTQEGIETFYEEFGFELEKSLEGQYRLIYHNPDGIDRLVAEDPASEDVYDKDCATGEFYECALNWKISRIWSAGNCKKLTPTLAQSHDPFIITYN